MALGAGSAIGEILPHRDSMLLLDRVLVAEEDRTVSEWRVPADSPWVENGVLRSAALLEVAAQTAAAGASIATDGRGRGLLGAISGLAFHGDARPGDRLVCHVDVRLRFEQLVRVVFRVEGKDDAVLASGELTLALVAPG